MTYKEIGTLAEIGASVGDVVEWLGNEMRESDFVSYEIDSIDAGTYHAKGCPGWFHLRWDDDWRIVPRAQPQGPVITETVKRIVPGVYGRVVIHTEPEFSCHTDLLRSRADLIAARDVLNQLIDAMGDE